MLPEQVAQLIDPILTVAFRTSEKTRHEATSATLAEFGSVGHGLLVLALQQVYEGDLERRAREIASQLKRVLELGMLGDSDAVGETLGLAFRERFAKQTQEIQGKWPERQGLPGFPLAELVAEIAGAACAELQLAAKEYLVRRRPPMPALDLLPEQEHLLLILVEASRRVPPANRARFLLVRSLSSRGRLIHPGVAEDAEGVYPGDVEELGAKSLLNLQLSARGDHSFDVRPEGFRYYRELRRRQGAGFERAERITKSYLDAGRFRQLYPEAFERWCEAESLLWSTQVEAQLTTIGHTLREGIQKFVSALVARYSPPEVPAEVGKDQARVKAVLQLAESVIGETTRKALEASWATTSNLIQRLEHGAHREREALTWEDARRAVFLVLLAMAEVDRAMSHVSPTRT